MSTYTSFFTGKTPQAFGEHQLGLHAQYINSSRTTTLVIPCVSHREDCAVGNVRGETMKLTVGFILIFCAMETVRCSAGRSPSRLWNYLKEFAWDRSTDVDNNRGPVLPLQVQIMPIWHVLPVTATYIALTVSVTEFHMMRARFSYAPEV